MQDEEHSEKELEEARRFLAMDTSTEAYAIAAREKVQSWKLSPEQVEAMMLGVQIMENDELMGNDVDEFRKLHNENYFIEIIQIIKDRELFDSSRNGEEVHEWFFGTFLNFVGNKLSRGDFHIYRGTLSPEGESSLILFDLLLDKATKAGCHYLKEDGTRYPFTEEYAIRQKKTIRQEIEEAG